MSTSYKHEDQDAMGLAKDHKLQRELDRENRDSEINRAMAEVAGCELSQSDICPRCRGNTPYEAGDDYGITLWAECKNCNNTGKVSPYYTSHIPNFLRDLNAVHPVESDILTSKPELRKIYRRILIDTCGDTEDSFTHYWRANARQRCEAILKTLNRWNPEWDYPI